MTLRLRSARQFQRIITDKACTRADNHSSVMFRPLLAHKPFGKHSSSEAGGLALLLIPCRASNVDVCPLHLQQDLEHENLLLNAALLEKGPPCTQYRHPRAMLHIHGQRFPNESVCPVVMLSLLYFGGHDKPAKGRSSIVLPPYFCPDRNGKLQRCWKQA